MSAHFSEPHGFTTAFNHTCKPNFLRRMIDWVLHWSSTPHAMLALFLISFAESSFFPIPPDVLIIAMCLATPHYAWRIAGVCTIASVLGALLGYSIGMFAWGQLSPLFFSYIPGFSAGSFERIKGLYHEWGWVIVFSAGFSPIPYKLFTIASGVMGLPLAPFLSASVISRASRFFLVAWFSKRFGSHVRTILDRHLAWITWIGCALVILGYAAVKWIF